MCYSDQPVPANLEALWKTNKAFFSNHMEGHRFGVRALFISAAISGLLVFFVTFGVFQISATTQTKTSVSPTNQAKTHTTAATKQTITSTPTVTATPTPAQPSITPTSTPQIVYVRYNIIVQTLSSDDMDQFPVKDGILFVFANESGCKATARIGNGAPQTIVTTYGQIIGHPKEVVSFVCHGYTAIAYGSTSLHDAITVSALDQYNSYLKQQQKEGFLQETLPFPLGTQPFKTIDE